MAAGTEDHPRRHEAGGSDADLREEYGRSQIEDRRRRAEELISEAQRVLTTDSGLAEQLARQALQWFARSLDWAEDTEDEDDAHQRMDAAGEWVRRTFGCHLTRSGLDYQQTCPVALGHNRIGMSIGASRNGHAPFVASTSPSASTFPAPRISFQAVQPTSGGAASA